LLTNIQSIHDAWSEKRQEVRYSVIFQFVTHRVHSWSEQDYLVCRRSTGLPSLCLSIW